METIAPPAPQPTAEQDAILSTQEQQAANAMELRASMENPDELRALRRSAEGKSDAEVKDLVKQLSVSKISEVDGKGAAADASIIKEKYGDNVAKNMYSTYLDYITMPDDKFEEAMDGMAQSQTEQDIEAEKAKLRFKYGSRAADAMGGDMLQKAAERTVGRNDKAAEESAIETTETPEEPLQTVTEEVGQAESTEAATDQEVAAAGNAMLDSLNEFNKKVDARIFADDDLSVSEYTDLVNKTMAAFERYTDRVGLSDVEKGQRLAALEKEFDRRKAQLDQYNEQRAARKTEVNTTPEVTSAEQADTAEAQEVQKRKGLRQRWNDVKIRGIMLMNGHIRGAFASNKVEQDSNERKLITKRRVIGAAALAGVGLLLYASNKNGWGLDINPFDGDGFDLNPFNKNPQGGEGLDVLPSAADGDGIDINVNDNMPAAEAAPNPEQAPIETATVHIDAGEGTSHIARDTLGINFDNLEDWNRFNDATNPLFEGIDGVYKDAASGEWRIQNPGQFQVPQSILDEMRRVAEEIKKS